MKRMAWLGILLGLTVPAVAFAATAPIEASMVVTGTITVNPDGSVKAYTIKDVDKLPPGARQIVQATVPHWQFKPVEVDGKATAATTGMSLRIVADIASDQSTSLRVSGAQFGCSAYQANSLLSMACPRDASVESIQRKPPQYPIYAARMGIDGEVFLVLQVDRSGHVAQVAASQVNLYVKTPDADYFRKVLADNSIAAARKWTFRVPTAGPQAARDHWIVRVPVDYHLGSWTPHKGSKRMCSATDTCDMRSWPGYGKWQAYVPGPKHDIPWANEASAAGAQASGDALAAGSSFFVPDARFVLKTPLAGSGSRS